MIKILGGQFRSRKLKTPSNSDITRPWIGRARESVFNQLRGHIDGGIILDLFAGVGTMGLEAVSRGAREVVLVEQDRKIYSLLDANITTLDCANRAIALNSDALSSIPLLRISRPVDIVFIDPPFSMMSNHATRNLIFNQMQRIEPLLSPEGFVILRTPVNPEVKCHTVDNLAGPEIHKHGAGMWILFYGTHSL